MSMDSVAMPVMENGFGGAGLGAGFNCKKENMLSNEKHQKKVDDFADQVRKETLKPIIEHLGKDTKEVTYYNIDSKQMSSSKLKD